MPSIPWGVCIPIFLNNTRLMKRQRIWGMNGHLVMYLLLSLAFLALVPFFFLIVNGMAFRQRADQVAVREPGRRTLGPPTDAVQEAREDLEFALLSEAAYQRMPDAKKIKAGEAIDVDKTLCDMKWVRWKDFPGDDPPQYLKTTIDNKHLRLEVWSNASTRKVAVTFGGTIGRNSNDWKSDLRWFIHNRDDEYTLIVGKFGSAFVEEYKRRQQLPDFSFLRTAQLFSTGHSLGGGLAHQFAYSLPPDSGVPRVTRVYAFDPSPVTGFYSVDEKLRNENSELLKIDRIYERGEILAFFRALTNLVYPPSTTKPAIRQVRYNLFYTWNPFARHSMADLAFRLDKVCNCREVVSTSLTGASPLVQRHD
jgi:hypothetical protein